MSLSNAEPLDGYPLPTLPVGPPYAAQHLHGFQDRKYLLKPGHPELVDIHDGEKPSDPALDNLVGMRRWWFEHPDWMDFLTPEHPGHEDKLLERELYLDHWSEFIGAAPRVMDLGGGIGRFTQWCLDQGCEVELVDPDLRSLWAAVNHAAGRRGALDVHWTTADKLPDLAPFDVIVAAEVLCYVPDARAVLESIKRVLKPGGVLLCSVEARYGWAMGPDVAEGSLGALFGEGIVHVEGDRWVQTYTEDGFRALLSDFEILSFEPSHYVMSGPFEAAAGDIDVDTIRAFEKRLRDDPVCKNLNRAWMAAVRWQG